MTDADGAMAFFYRSLNCWVVSRLLKLYARGSGTCADTCQNNFRHVEFPLTFQLTFLVQVRGKTVTRAADCCPFWVFAENFRGVKVA
jgi:hypothetical protein